MACALPYGRSPGPKACRARHPRSGERERCARPSQDLPAGQSNAKACFAPARLQPIMTIRAALRSLREGLHPAYGLRAALRAGLRALRGACSARKAGQRRVLPSPPPIGGLSPEAKRLGPLGPRADRPCPPQPQPAAKGSSPAGAGATASPAVPKHALCRQCAVGTPSAGRWVCKRAPARRGLRNS